MGQRETFHVVLVLQCLMAHYANTVCHLATMVRPPQQLIQAQTPSTSPWHPSASSPPPSGLQHHGTAKKSRACGASSTFFGLRRGSSSVLARLSFALLEERLGFPTVFLDVVSQRSRRQHRMCLPDISFRPFLHLPPPADMFWPRPQLKLL